MKVHKLSYEMTSYTHLPIANFTVAKYLRTLGAEIREIKEVVANGY